MIYMTTGRLSSGMTLSSTPCVSCGRAYTRLFADGRCIQCTPVAANMQCVGDCSFRAVDQPSCTHPVCLVPCTPPAENSEAVGGPSAEDGQGVCTLSETDISLLRSYNERVDAYEVLLHSRLGRKSGPIAAAMFTARCALTSAIDQNVRDFRTWGMLLHVGAVK